MSICKQCGEVIKEKAINALGSRWHPHCFTCHYCKKKITGQQFLTFAGNIYHQNCLKCAGCKQSIKSRYIESENLPWHDDCYKRQHYPKCSVCRKPLTRRYFLDFWGNAYCNSHQNYATCNSCGRIVCDNLTSGGMQYPDGLLICNLCGLHGVATQERADRIMQEMRSALASVGLALNKAQVPLRLCGRDELHESSRHDFHEERPILGLARWSITSSNGRVIARTFKDILIQKNLPESHFRTVAIHELTHAWFFYHNFRDIPIEVEEGMCVLMEYIWLKSQKTKEAKYYRTAIVQSQDPVYGEGFREARKALKLMPLKVLLQFIKEKRKFPNRFSAFFYY